MDKILTIPLIKLVESERENAKLDAILSPGLGGGIEVKYEKTLADSTTKTIFSFSPFTIILSGETHDSIPIDVAYCWTFGFFNDRVGFGIGMNLGDNKGKSKYFGLLSLGINLK